MNVVELLTAAKEKIGTPEKWCKETFALDSNGRSVGALDDDACRWCIDGALIAVRGALSDEYSKAYSFIWRASKRVPLGFNDADSTTHPDVMRVFSDAIALAKQEAAA